MIEKSIFSVLGLCLLLAACGRGPSPASQEVDEFAARIGSGENQTAAPTQAPVTPVAIADQITGNEASSQQETSASDSLTPVCGSPKVAPFFGRQADNFTREAVLTAVAPNNDVRFIDAGSDVSPVPSSSRLNVKVDAMGVIRSATCG